MGSIAIAEYRYPAMPVTSYPKMTRKRRLAIKAYLFSLKPVYVPRAPNDMAFPFEIHWTLVVWRELYFHPGGYQPDLNRAGQWNRGASIVEGTGHCGEYPSPRNIFDATETQHSLAGGEVDKWLAPEISADPRWGVGDRSTSDIVTFLKTGAQKRRASPSDPCRRWSTTACAMPRSPICSR